MKNKATIRPMTVEDIDQVLIIERASFATPWSRDAFKNEVTNNQFAHYVVLEVDNRILAYCGVWIIVDEAHITNIAVLPAFRGLKLGETLLSFVKVFAKGKGALSMTLEVRVSNEAAQNLYRKFGFQDGGIRKKYYSDNGENALVMWVKLND